MQTASAGSAPSGRIHPLTLRALEDSGYDIAGLASQGIDELEAFQPEVVVTVCDRAAGEACPLWVGRAVRGHWSLPDPSAGAGSEEERLARFAPVMATIGNRVRRLLEAPLESLDREALSQLVNDIGEMR